MKHFINIDGYTYKLRPVTLDDAEFIVSVRLEDKERNKYINTISGDINEQIKWLNAYFERDGDYYFIVENKLTSNKEGLISIYNINEDSAEWGRWVIRKGSLAAVESVYLIYEVAFNLLNLRELYCRTIIDNVSVVSFHDSLSQNKRNTVNQIELNDIPYDCVEHFVTKDYYVNELKDNLEKKASLIFQRNFKQYLVGFKFHHIGVATTDINKEFETYKMLGYAKESYVFEDELQGIKGLFITANGQPRLELLENLNGSHTLDYWINNKNKMYHFAYCVENIEKVIEIFKKNRFKIVSPLKTSVYFRKRICFLMSPNTYIIELIEV
jgi:RimJ/RimL family protein N-acetyltransferase